MIETKTQNGVLDVTIRGGGNDNRLALSDLAQLQQTFIEFDADPALRIVKLTSGGTFSAGLASGDFDAAKLNMAALSGKLVPYRPRKPVIAAIRGHCGGEAMIWLCQLAGIRIASVDATFQLGDVQRGFAAATARSRLNRQMPYAQAIQLALTGETVAADRALDIGLITQIVDDPEARADEIIAEVLKLSNFALWGELETVINGEGMTQYDNFYFANSVDMVSHFSPDIHEGVEAFVQKRQAVYWDMSKD